MLSPIKEGMKGVYYIVLIAAGAYVFFEVGIIFIPILAVVGNTNLL